MTADIEMVDKREDERLKRKLDMELDRELEATFPASDALKITRNSSHISERSTAMERARTGQSPSRPSNKSSTS